MGWDEEAFNFVRRLAVKLPKKKRGWVKVGKNYVEWERDRSGYFWVLITGEDGIKVFEAQMHGEDVSYVDLSAVGWVEEFEKNLRKLG